MRPMRKHTSTFPNFGKASSFSLQGEETQLSLSTPTYIKPPIWMPTVALVSTEKAAGLPSTKLLNFRQSYVACKPGAVL